MTEKVEKVDRITHWATVYKVQTLVFDNSVRVTLDLPETAVMQAAMYMECQRLGVVLDITAVPKVQNVAKEETVDGKKGRMRKSIRGA